MKKTPFLILAIFFGGALFDLVPECMALDESGCLTCHQYPGLVRLEKQGGLKVLDIDEAKYAASAHGKIDCRNCHTQISQVPHTGVTAVDCTTHCHLKGKERQQVKDFPLKSFHVKEQSYIVRLDDETSCRVCHPLYPHSENALVRALLNMHTGFMLCEVCHVRKEDFPDIFYEWRDSENADFSGKPFGTYFNPKTQQTHRSEHFISRIAVFLREDGQKQLIVNAEDTPRAREFLKREKHLKSDQKQSELAHFHRHIAKKEISVACDECHSAHSILDFRRLGFDDINTNHLVNLNIKGLVTKYKTFFFPQLFEK